MNSPGIRSVHVRRRVAIRRRVNRGRQRVLLSHGSVQTTERYYPRGNGHGAIA